MVAFVEPLWNSREVEDFGALKRISMPCAGRLGPDLDGAGVALTRLLEERWVDSPWAQLPAPVTAVTAYFEQRPLAPQSLQLLVTAAEPIDGEELAGRAMARDLARACRDLALQRPASPGSPRLAAAC